MLERLRREVYQANLRLVREGLVIHTWGNASGIDRKKGLVVIKPSGVPYGQMKAQDMVLVRLETGEVVHSKLKPSSDTATHLALYRAFPGISGIVHTHSLYATAWAQTCRALPALGTTHADYFHGAIPCTRLLTPAEIASDYEANTGKVIVETFGGRDPLACPGVLVASHGPFAWGASVADAVHHAAILEHLARLAGETLRLLPAAKPMNQALLDKHFLRKHGPGAYYGQTARSERPGPSGNKTQTT
ncbi:MAG TPA: L-ribulose-5-phosphate 4-epimerase [Verrucomicrobiae bacterium]|nr:L-ribulose-5-phosphate 4-epimerase [Verrucomicrobiae bacterium]